LEQSIIAPQRSNSAHLHRPWRAIGGRAGDYTDKFLADGNAVVDALATATNQRLFRDEAR
jgi:hypothetical protein